MSRKNSPKRKKNENKRLIQQMRRRRLLHSLCLMGLLCLIGIAIVSCIRLIGQKKTSLIEAFHVSEEFPTHSDYDDSQRESTFAKNLCVGEDNLSLEGVSLNKGQNGVLLNLDDKTVLFSNNMYEKLYPASMTKIMTALLALEAGNTDEIVTISQEAVTLEEGSQVCGFAPGDKVSMGDLIRLLLVYSGNDAASAIAETIGGTQDQFVQMMNDKARQLGMTGSHFTNPHGLQDEEHYTTAYDIYLMLNEAMNNKEFLSIIELNSYTANYEAQEGNPRSVTLESTDHYLTGEATAPRGVTILGGKTGTTSEAGNCLALISQNAYGKPFISIISNAESKELLYEQMNSLLATINS